MTTSGGFHNWGYGPAFTVNNTASKAPTPKVTFDNITLSLSGWHVHSPADHSVGGDRSKAELHMVWVNAENKPKAVFAIRLDPGASTSKFWSQMTAIGDWPLWSDKKTDYPMQLNFESLLKSPNYFSEFWTYSGSLTSPPCTEGIRWFVARQIHFMSVDQMKKILRISTYSARAEQEVWLQGVNA